MKLISSKASFSERLESSLSEFGNENGTGCALPRPGQGEGLEVSFMITTPTSVSSDFHDVTPGSPRHGVLAGLELFSRSRSKIESTSLEWCEFCEAFALVFVGVRKVSRRLFWRSWTVSSILSGIIERMLGNSASTSMFRSSSGKSLDEPCDETSLTFSQLDIKSSVSTRSSADSPRMLVLVSSSGNITRACRFTSASFEIASITL